MKVISARINWKHFFSDAGGPLHQGDIEVGIDMIFLWCPTTKLVRNPYFPTLEHAGYPDVWEVV